MNTGDIIQINAPEFNPDIDSGHSMKEHGEIQGSDNPIQHRVGETKKSEAPALPQQVKEEVDWPNAVPVEILLQLAQDNDYTISLVSIIVKYLHWRVILTKKKRDNLRIYKPT